MPILANGREKRIASPRRASWSSSLIAAPVPRRRGSRIPTPFDPDIDPSIYGEFEIELKDGRKTTVRPVWDLYAKRCAEYTPERASELTGVDAQLIEDACLEWAIRKDPRYGNGGLHFQLATDQTGNSTHLVRMLMILSHITGNYDTPGGNRGETKAQVEVSPGVCSYECSCSS